MDNRTFDIADSEYLINGKRYEYRRVGHVYVLESQDGMHVKIGRSRKPQSRLKDLRAAYNTEGREYVSPLQSDCVRLELECHRANKSSRLRGEWFRLDFESAVGSVASRLTEPEGVAPDLVSKILEVEGKLMDKRVDLFISIWLSRLGNQIRTTKESSTLEALATAAKSAEQLSPAMQLMADNLLAAELLGVPLHLAQVEAVKQTERLTGQGFRHLLPAPDQSGTLNEVTTLAPEVRDFR